MTSSLDMTVRLAPRFARIGWFYGINSLIADRLVSKRPSEIEEPSGKSRIDRDIPTRPVPSRGALFSELRQLMIEDAEDAGRGINPGEEIRPERLASHIGRLRAMFRDLPGTVERREQGVFDTAKSHVAGGDVGGLPEYYAQDFHFQTGGHLSDGSARIYDVQVETLFYGSGDLMRRAAFRPLHTFLHGRDQRRVELLDVACGTGRFLRSVRRQYPRMRLAGLDLSPAYLDEARRHMDDLRPVDWHRANAEAMPVASASQDIVTSIFLFHELPAAARRAVAREVARVLRPGGLFVMIDSLQFGDKPGWDGLLEAFPERFHEPYYRHYLIDDLTVAFAATGLEPKETRHAFLSKVMTFVKSG